VIIYLFRLIYYVTYVLIEVYHKIKIEVKMELDEKKITSSMKFNGKLLRVYEDSVELINRKITTREYIKHPGGACIAALTKADELLFVRQFRYPYGKVILELPAGKLDGKEDPLAAAKRELKEETGTSSEKYIFLGEVYPSPGYTDEIIYLYACRIQAEGKNKLDDDEFLDIERIPIEKAVASVFANEIADSKSQIAILKIAELLKEHKI
jgi:ADP-ribose pyrophosphatase